jgi:arylsulfatase A-like enzyme
MAKMTTRRQFMKSTAAAIVGLPLLNCGSNRRRPNVLFIWTDEQRADTMKVYGNNKIHTPNLNKLASESIVFEHAYVSQPVCTPSRSTVLTGLWPHSNGCVENNIPLPDDVPCLPELVNDPEYRTGYLGKWHLGDEIFAQHGFEEWVSIEDNYIRFYSDGRDRNAESSYCTYLKSLGYQPDTSTGTFSRSFAARLPIEHCKPKFLERQVCDFMTRHKNSPFIMHVNFLEPHMPFFGPLNNEHTMDEIDLPINFNDPLEANEPLLYRQRHEQYLRQGYGKNDLNTEAGWRRLIANYWGLVTQVDLSVGAILEKLEALGIADNTIVVYMSDHGDMMGAHRLLAKTVMYEESVKVPWLMRIPWVSHDQKIMKGRYSHIDLMPTLLDAMHCSDAAVKLPGRSLVPVIRGEETYSDDVFIEWNPALQRGKPLTSMPSISDADSKRVHEAYTRTVITQDGWKLCLSDQDKSQLFNLNIDPGETTNLFDQGKYSGKIDKLKKKIFAWQKRVGDTVSFAG